MVYRSCLVSVLPTNKKNVLMLSTCNLIVITATDDKWQIAISSCNRLYIRWVIKMESVPVVCFRRSGEKFRDTRNTTGACNVTAWSRKKFLERLQAGNGLDEIEGGKKPVTCETELLARLESAQAFVPYPRLTCAPPLPPDLTLPELTSLWR